MAAASSVLFLLFRMVCYVALIVVVVGFGAMIVLTATGLCPSLGSGGVNCTAPFYQSVGELALGVMLVTVFTGIPLLLALAGLFFLLRKIILRRNAAAITAATPDAGAPGEAAADRTPPAKSSGLAMLVLKAVVVLLGAAFLFGAIASIMSEAGG